LLGLFLEDPFTLFLAMGALRNGGITTAPAPATVAVANPCTCRCQVRRPANPS
jgi:hypothetical protein